MTSCDNDFDDIEDMVVDNVDRDKNSRNALVFSKVNESNESTPSGDLNVPGSQVIWLKTYGCSHNISDSEYMQGVLCSYGYKFTEDRDIADLWLLNSCTVKDPSQAAFMHLVKKGREQNKALVVAGCVPQADRNLKGLEGVSVVGIQQVDRVVEVVEETLKGHTVRLLSKKRLPQLDLPKIRKNPLVEIVPLSTGCLGACTYCKTKHARGKLGSYSPDAIVGRINSVVQEGVMEVWLSSEDTGAYGRDIKTDLPTLLKTITSNLPKDIMLRVGMTNPPFILDHLEGIAEALNHPNVFAFLHVPVQSGSNSVLTTMNREYTVEEFKKVADYLIEHVPGVTIATDIICGFPGETEEEFDETYALVEAYRFHIMNISQFYPRPGTPAAKMKRIATHIVKERSRRLTRLFESFDPYVDMVGKEMKIWINTETSDDKKHTVGHTKNYTKVLIPRDDTLIGCTAIVKILSSSRFHVVAEVLSCTEPVTTYIANYLKNKNKESSINIKTTKKSGNGDEECCGGSSCSPNAAKSAKKDSCCGGSCNSSSNDGSSSSINSVVSYLKKLQDKSSDIDIPATVYIGLGLSLGLLITSSIIFRSRYRS